MKEVVGLIWRWMIVDILLLDFSTSCFNLSFSQTFSLKIQHKASVYPG
jgi:hypothetical protein